MLTGFKAILFFEFNIREYFLIIGILSSNINSNNMKKSIILLSVVAILTLSSFVTMHVDTYKLDTNQSTLEWYAEKLTGKHNGTINFSNGEIRDQHGSYSGEFEVDMTSIKDKDIESEDKRTKLENHLKSPDFFDAKKFPISKFVITSVTPVAKNESGFTHNVKGKLTIKDKTNDIAFDAVMKKLDNGISCSGSMIVDRSKYDVKYGSKTFYEDIGDKIIYDNFTLKFNIVATK